MAFKLTSPEVTTDKLYDGPWWNKGDQSIIKQSSSFPTYQQIADERVSSAYRLCNEKMSHVRRKIVTIKERSWINNSFAKKSKVLFKIEGM